MAKPVHCFAIAALLLGAFAPQWLGAAQPADTAPPVLTATVTPPASATGWRQVPATVSYACSDAGSGVKICPEPITVYSDGAGQIVSASAEDHAGNVATTTVTVNIDMSPPELLVQSPPSGAAVYTPTVTITGTVTDTVSGVEAVSCAGAAGVVSSGTFSCTVVLQPGPNDVSIDARDVAENITSTIHRVLVGDRLTVTPSTLTIPTEGAHQLQLIDAQGGTVAGAVWTVSDPAVLSLSGAGATATVTGIAAGQATVSATLNGAVAAATVTVSSGSALPAGSVRWSLSPTPGEGRIESRIVQAQNDSGEGADLFWIEGTNGHLHVRGLSHSGVERWRAFLPYYALGWEGPFAVADPDGGLILNAYYGETLRSSVVRLDGATGAETWRVESPEALYLERAAVHPDGIVLARESWSEGGVLSNVLVALNTATGQEIFTVPLALWSDEVFSCSNSIRQYPGSPSLTVGPDGYFYAVETHYRKVEQAQAPCSTNDYYTYSVDQIVSLLKISVTGTVTRTVLDTFQRSTTSRQEADDWRPPWAGGALPSPTGGMVVSLVRTLEDTLTVTRRSPRRSTFSPSYTTTLIEIDGGARTDYEQPGQVLLSVIASNGLGRAQIMSDWSTSIRAVDLATGGSVWETPLQDYSNIISLMADGSVLVSEPSSGAFATIDAMGDLTALPGITAPMATLAVNGDLVGIVDGRLTAFVGLDTAVDDGPWPMPEGNQQRQRAAPVPTLVAEPSTLIRGQTVAIRATGLSGNQVQSWSFRPTDTTLPQIVRGPTSLPFEWPGMMVTSGVVRVSFQRGSQTRQLSRSITVQNRDWKLPPVSPQEVENGTGEFNLIDPPVPPSGGQPSSRLGESRVRVRVRYTSIPVDDFGPNDGCAISPV